MCTNACNELSWCRSLLSLHKTYMWVLFLCRLCTTLTSHHITSHTRRVRERERYVSTQNAPEHAKISSLSFRVRIITFPFSRYVSALAFRLRCVVMPFRHCVEDVLFLIRYLFQHTTSVQYFSIIVHWWHFEWNMVDVLLKDTYQNDPFFSDKETKFF